MPFPPRRRGRLLWLAPVVALAAAAALVTSTLPSRAAPTGVEGIPALKHVFVIVLENKDFASTWGVNSDAHYLRSLAPTGAFAPYYYGVGHLSADNYIAMTSGQSPTPTFMADCPNYAACLGYQESRPDGGRNITDQLAAKALTWKAYMDGMGTATPCKHPDITATNDPYQNGYATRHDPFVYYPSVVGFPPGAAGTPAAAVCDSHVVDGSALQSDLASATTTPNFSFIVPDTCQDGHDVCAPQNNGELQIDAFLHTVVPAIENSPAFRDRGALFITFDESDVTTSPSSQAEYKGCCASGPDGSGLDGGGQVGLLLLSPLAQTDTASRLPYDHFSLLRTIEDGFGITEHLNQAGAATERPMADLFASGNPRSQP